MWRPRALGYDRAVFVPPLPPRPQIELTNTCGLSCPSCARHHWDPGLNRDGGVDSQHLDKLEPLFLGAEEVTIGGYGDPTESPHLLDCVRRIRRAGAASRLITGGAKLNAPLIEALAEAGLGRLVLSMDGASDERLKALRGVPLRAYLRWMEAARAAARRWGRPTFQLHVVAQRDNVEELPALVDLAADEGATGVHVFHLKSHAAGLDERSLWNDPEGARPSFLEAARRADRRGVFLHLPTLDAAPIACRQPYETLFVRHDGRVRGCCSALFLPDDHGLSAGHIDDLPFDQLWLAPELLRFRQAAESGDEPLFPTPCQRCPFRVPGLASHRRHLAVGHEAGP